VSVPVSNGQAGGRQAGGLDGVDPFRTLGFSTPATAGQAQGAGQQASYSNVPLSQIPAKSTEQQFATAAPVMQQQRVVTPPAPYMTNQSMYQTAAGTMQQQQLWQQQQMMQSQQQQQPYAMPGQYNTMAGGGVGYGGQGMMQPGQQQFATQGGYGGYGMPQQQQQASAYNPFGAADPFAARPPAPASFAPSMAGQQSTQAWDPFSAQQQAQQQQVTPPAPAAVTAAAWDPFSQQQQQMQQQQQYSTQQAAPPPAPQQPSGWADLSDADIWGDAAGTAKKGGGGGDDDGDWSDDDGEDASDDGEAASPARRASQVETDFELALRLQREEEARADEAAGIGRRDGGADGDAGDGGYGGGGRRGAPRNPGDKPDGECLARISVRTLLVKKWKPTYFIFELPDLLLLYRSRDDYLYNPKGTMIKKRIELKYNHTLTQLKRKVYKDTGYLWHFTLEEQLDYGPSVVAKFAHHEKRPLEDVGNRIAEAIREKRRLRARFNNNQLGGGGIGSNMSSIGGSGGGGSGGSGAVRRDYGGGGLGESYSGSAYNITRSGGGG
ncbi:unnamed protein product, partial [Phaeothamnion confervicola]